MENRPRISNWIGGGYVFLAAFIIALYVTMLLLLPFPNLYASLVFNAVMIVVSISICAIAASIYGTAYRIEKGGLHSWAPFAVIDIRLKDIAKAGRTMIPFSFKGFGASAYCGWFYIPTVGWTRVIITNLSDGVLIRTKDGKNYLVTPSNPKGFIKALKVK